MNRRAFLGSGLMSLFVGVFALLMGGGLPRPKQREGKAVPIGGGEVSLGITPMPDYLRILKPWDGKPLQEAGTMAFSMQGPEDIEAFKEAWQEACSGHGYAVYPSALPPALSAAESVSWDTPPKPTPLADMRRIHTPGTLARAPGRQFGLG